MNILITGKNGFLAKDAIDFFSDENDIFPVSHIDSNFLLFEYYQKCDMVFHFAAVQRSDNDQDFVVGNIGYTQKLIDFLEKNMNYAPIMYS